MFARVSFGQCNYHHCPHTFSIYVVNDQLQICSHPCSDDVNRQGQQCWCIPIHIVYPKDVLSHMQITSNHMGRDLESGVDVPSPTSPNVAPDFAHHGGDTVLHSHGAKLHHAKAVLVYNEGPAPRYAARVLSNTGHWLPYILARNGQEQVHFGWSTWRAWLSENPDCTVQFSSSVTFGQAIIHSVFSAKGQRNALA